MMPSIMLKDGDFGAAAEVTVNETEFFLPDPARPGLREVVPFSAVEGIDTVADDRSAQYREAMRLGFKGLSVAGPIGLAASVLAVRKPKTVVFSVRLKDGRSFVATAEAANYARIHGAYLSARRQPANEGETAEERAADAIVARYMTKSADVASHAARPPLPESASAFNTPPRPVFGRRRS
jgi:hypothetical protein